MRVGIFLGELAPTAGGAHTYQQTLLDNLRHHDTGHEFLCFHYGAAPAAAASGMRHVRLEPRGGTNSRLGGLARAMGRRQRLPSSRKRRALQAAARAERIELMWFPTQDWEPVDVPFIYTVWDLQHRLQPCFPEVSVTGLDFDRREEAFRHILPRATWVVVPNEALRDEVQLFYGLPAGRIAMLPQPTPDFALAAAATATPAPRSLAGDPLFYPAQFWPHKNHVVLLHALRLLRDRDGLRPRLILTGADKGNLAHVRATGERLGVWEQVEHRGFVPQAELASLYQQAFALVFPSFFGPENLPPLEAFALGCPVVAARVSGAEHQLGDAALLFDPRSEEELRRALLRLQDEAGLRATLTARGAARAQAWSGREFSAALLRLIDEFAGVRRCWSSDTPYVHS